MTHSFSFARLALAGAALAFGMTAQAAAPESITQKHARFLTEPHGYVAYHTTDRITIDGLMDEAAWKHAPETELFHDISGEGFPAPKYATRAKMLWDEDYLYVSAVMEEPNVWANLTVRDTVVYYDPDFEIFLDPTGDAHNYYELEFNAKGVLFDLSLEMPYRAPRRNFVQFQWDCPGLKYAIHVDGTVNDNRDTDRGWQIEVAIPHEAISQEFDNVLKAGQYMRVGFSRVEWQTEKDASGRTFRKKGPDGNYLPEDNWTWPSTGQIAMHMPERWGYVYLAPTDAGDGTEQFRYPAYRPIEKLLWAMFYEQEKQMEKTGRYLNSAKAFKLTADEKALLPKGSSLTVEAIAKKYLITVKTPDGLTMTIDEDGQILRTEAPAAQSAAHDVRCDVPVYGWYKWDPDRTSPAKLKGLFEKWKSHGVKGVCVECGGFLLDRIETAAKIAHSVGLEYHAWVPSMLQGGKPESWYTVNRLGKSAYNKDDRAYVEYYQTVDPHNPDVVKYLAENYAKVAEIPEVDYVQLDYIRYADVVLSEGLWVKYDTLIHHNWGNLEVGPFEGSAKPASVNEYPVADYCYCDACVADFKAKTGIDIRAKVAAGVDPASIGEWAQFRCDNVTNCVNAIARAVHAKGKKISADVFPGPKSYAEWMVRQQWHKWDVDVYFPMNYNDFYLRGADWVGTVTKEEVETVGQGKKVYSGLFICHDWKQKSGDIDPENSGLVPSEIVRAVEASMEAGAAGVCLFCPNHMTEAHWAEFDKAIGLKK